MDNTLLEEQILKIDKSSWRLTKLGEVAEDISERVDKPGSSKYNRFVGLEHFVSGDLKIQYWSSTATLTSSAKAFKKGDILFARRNAYLRRASLVEFEGCCSGDAFVIRENQHKVVPGYLAFLMNSHAIWNYANSNAAGTMSQRVKWRDLAKYEFLLPPRPEQVRLMELLTSIVEVIEKEREILVKLEKLKESLNTQYFNDYKSSDKRIGEHSLKVGSGVTPKGGSKVYVSEGIIFLRSQNVLFGEFDLTDVAYITEVIDEGMSSTRVNRGDVLLNITGASIGRSAVYDFEKKANVNQHVCIIRCNDQLDPFFLSEFINSSYGQEQIGLFQAGGNREGLNFANIRRMRFPNFDIMGQRKLMIEYKNISRTRDISRAKLEMSRSLLKNLINQIF